MDNLMNESAQLLSVDYGSEKSKKINPYEHVDILIIEDEELMSALVKRYVQAIELPHAPTKNLKVVDRGWDLLTADLSNIKVAVVDILLPQVTGVDLIKSFRKRYPNMAIIPITGMATEPMRRQLREVLDQDYLILDKPLRRHEFQEAFEKAWSYKKPETPPPSANAEGDEQLWSSVKVDENRAQNIPIVRRKLVRKKASNEEKDPDKK